MTRALSDSKRRRAAPRGGTCGSHAQQGRSRRQGPARLCERSPGVAPCRGPSCPKRGAPCASSGLNGEDKRRRARTAALRGVRVGTKQSRERQGAASRRRRPKRDRPARAPRRVAAAAGTRGRRARARGLLSFRVFPGSSAGLGQRVNQIMASTAGAGLQAGAKKGTSQPPRRARARRVSTLVAGPHVRPQVGQVVCDARAQAQAAGRVVAGRVLAAVVAHHNPLLGRAAARRVHVDQPH